jgi:hypothetical protein
MLAVNTATLSRIQEGFNGGRVSRRPAVFGAACQAGLTWCGCLFITGIRILWLAENEGPKCPVLHADQDQVDPIGSSKGLAVAQGHLPRRLWDGMKAAAGDRRHLVQAAGDERRSLAAVTV